VKNENDILDVNRMRGRTGRRGHTYTHQSEYRLDEKGSSASVERNIRSGEASGSVNTTRVIRGDFQTD
jgi:hypothetical protein